MKTHRLPPEGRPHPPAFTLIELLVVITIISILAALSMGVFSFAQQSASRNRTFAGLATIVNGLEQYKERFGEYPEAADTNSMGSGSSSRLKVGGAVMLYQAITGDGYDNIKDADKANPPGSPNSDGKVDDNERANSIRGDLPKNMIINTSNGYMLVDGFGHPFQYEKGVVSTGNGTEPNPNAVNSTFDVWSFAQLNPEKDMDKVSNDVSVKKDDKKNQAWIKNW